MDLHDKYLPRYDYHEVHQLAINATPDEIYSLVKDLDFSGSWIIRMLFFLRGMSNKKITFEGLAASKFMVLEETPKQELIIGLIGQFWKPSGELQAFAPTEFKTFEGPYAKATWNFVMKREGNRTMLSTETRIACPDEKTRRSFSRYWFFIRPFSGLIRMEMLRAIRNKAISKMKRRPSRSSAFSRQEENCDLLKKG